MDPDRVLGPVARSPGASVVAAHEALRILEHVWYALPDVIRWRQDVPSWKSHSRVSGEAAAESYEALADELLEAAAGTPPSDERDCLEATYRCCQEAANQCRTRAEDVESLGVWVEEGSPAPNPWITPRSALLMFSGQEPIDEHALYHLMLAVERGDPETAELQLPDIASAQTVSGAAYYFVLTAMTAVRIVFPEVPLPTAIPEAPIFGSGVRSHLHDIHSWLDFACGEGNGQHWIVRVTARLAVRAPEEIDAA